MKRILFTCLLLTAPALAQPAPDYADHYDTSISGEPVVSVDVFYDQLTPYGAWVDDPELGRVFTPEAAAFVPYTVGHWQYTDVGFVWIAPQPFEWATAHYGRWAYSKPFARWVWLPDTVWGPSWVEWRQSGEDFGWAPLAPEIAIRVGYTPPLEAWHYCGAGHILDVNVTRYYEPANRVVIIHQAAQPMEHYAQIGGARVVVGPSPAVLHAHRVEARPVKLEAHAVGRWTPTEAIAQGKRAEERKPANEEANRKRIESTPALRVVAKPAAVQPAPKVQPAKPAGKPEYVSPKEQPKVQPAKPAGKPDYTAPKEPKVQPAKPAGKPDYVAPKEPKVQPAKPAGKPDYTAPKEPKVQPAKPAGKPDYTAPKEPKVEPSKPAGKPDYTTPKEPKVEPSKPAGKPEYKEKK